MPELRQNPITFEWVIIAPEREKRPFNHRKTKIKPKLEEYDPKCPFCPGNNVEIPLQAFSMKCSGQEAPIVFSFRNKYPALISNPNHLEEETNGYFHKIEGFGFHEVIVENPKHNLTFGTYNDEEAFLVVKAYHERCSKIYEDRRISYVTIFQNHGKEAGASLSHPHSQLIGTPFVPTRVQTRQKTASEFYKENQTCIVCNLIQKELEVKKRVICETSSFLVISPFAARDPFETWIIPKIHHTSFNMIDEKELESLGAILNLTLGKLKFGLNDPDYNLIFRSAPIKEKAEEYYHWYIEIFPRLRKTAGFEIGSGIYVNTSIPEQNAKLLREITLK
ncbi:MAG: galactose-1-phosphate uridylyltransferase [Promethearchaeota archaeon]